MSLQPPLDLGRAGPILCSRSTGPDPEHGDRCHNDATFHVIWRLGEMVNGLCCDEHMDEARGRWVYFAAHSYEMACSMPGAVFDADANRCFAAELIDLAAAEVAAIAELTSL